MARAFRCSTLSLSLDEPLHATASTVRNWVLLEQPGPWGYDAVVQSRLAKGSGARLLALARSLAIRIVLLRRPGGAGSRPFHCFLAHAGPDAPWLERLVLEDPADLLDVDLLPLAEGRPTGSGDVQREPIHVVCTNGRRDPCCAEQGRPLARALAARFGERVWECSHIGGDRFAANLVCFPHGLYFGRLAPDRGLQVAEGYERGAIDLEHYRGRSCYDFGVQAAEHHLRHRHDLWGVDDVSLVASERSRNGRLIARFATTLGRSFSIEVDASRGAEARLLTCHSPEPLRPRTFELLDEGS